MPLPAEPQVRKSRVLRRPLGCSRSSAQLGQGCPSGVTMGAAETVCPHRARYRPVGTASPAASSVSSTWCARSSRMHVTDTVVGALSSYPSRPGRDLVMARSRSAGSWLFPRTVDETGVLIVSAAVDHCPYCHHLSLPGLALARPSARTSALTPGRCAGTKASGVTLRPGRTAAVPIDDSSET